MAKPEACDKSIRPTKLRSLYFKKNCLKYKRTHFETLSENVLTIAYINSIQICLPKQVSTIRVLNRKNKFEMCLEDAYVFARKIIQMYAYSYL